jgi:hypothetical protein
VKIFEELLEWKISGSGQENRINSWGIRCADHAPPSIHKKLALTSPTSGGRSVGIVRLRTKGHGVKWQCKIKHITWEHRTRNASHWYRTALLSCRRSCRIARRRRKLRISLLKRKGGHSKSHAYRLNTRIRVFFFR